MTSRTRTPRMRRLWLPFRTAPTALAGASNVRVDVKSQLEAQQDRELFQFTVTRIIVGMSFSSDNSGRGTFMYGMKFENDNVSSGLVTPLNDPTADWLFWGESPIEFNRMEPQGRIDLDINTQCRARGSSSALWFIVVNNTSYAGDFQVTGRALVLIQ